MLVIITKTLVVSGYRTSRFFFIMFFAIIHRTIIVQNKIVRIICSCLFFCPASIYGPSLGKVWLVRPNQNCFSRSIFDKKRTFYSELYALQCINVQFSILIFIYLKTKIVKNMSTFLTIYIIIIIIYFFLNWRSICHWEVFADVNAIYLTSIR